MPFTPLHMGPGILVKSLLNSSFSLMVFGWTQIVMDLQPLFVIITGEGHLHGFTHTYIGATLIAVVSALTGKYFSEWGLGVLARGRVTVPCIRWWVVVLSAFIGSYSHVLLDSIMHADVEPFFPFTTSNGVLGIMSISALHWLCLISGGVGTCVYSVINWRIIREGIH